MTLTARQARFVKEYFRCLNGTQAAIAAGYSQRTARAIASENLRKPSIREEIANLERSQQERLTLCARVNGPRQELCS
jgi:phage terminase small subunit